MKVKSENQQRKINETQTWFFEKVNKIDESSAKGGRGRGEIIIGCRNHRREKGHRYGPQTPKGIRAQLSPHKLCNREDPIP